jgi:hypothetical protein
METKFAFSAAETYRAFEISQLADFEAGNLLLNSPSVMIETRWSGTPWEKPVD